MEIVIIGTGNAATVLGHKLKKAGHRISQVFGRNSVAASKLAYELGTVSANYWNIVNKHADVYIIAVTDIAIEEVVKELRLPDKIIVHTAASVSKQILASATSHYGVFYPLQSLKKDLRPVNEIPIIIDAGDPATLELLDSLAHTITTRVVMAGDEARLKLHLAAVMVNNFVNYLYRLAEEYCKAEGIDFQLLLPLIKETADRLGNISAVDSQTGPAVRDDAATVRKHLQMLHRYPELEKFYRLFSESISSSR